MSPEIAASALLMSINRTIAWAWTAAFAVLAVAEFVSSAAGGRGWGTAVSVVVIVAAVRFTTRYPDRAVAAARVDRPAPVPIG